MHVLVVDDDFEVRDLLVRAIERDGHTVTAVQTSAEARRVLSRRATDVVVLDLALPDGTGVELCIELRAALDTVPVLMLTAHSDVSERVRSLDAGADDFLAKPFAVAELRARARFGSQTRQTLSSPKLLLDGGVSLDLMARRAHKQGKSVALTAREWAILEALAGASGRVVSRVSLLQESWGDVSDAAAASLEVLIGRIRRKLGENVIRTVRGIGYSFGEP